MATNSTYRKTYPISWDQLHRDSKALAWRLLSMDFFKGIIAITRGGLVPAAIIARELDIHLVDTICISSYDWKDKKGEADILKKANGDGQGWLLVDDLVDTGLKISHRSPSYRETRGTLRPDAAIISRMTSLTPPPNVMTKLRLAMVSRSWNSCSAVMPPASGFPVTMKSPGTRPRRWWRNHSPVSRRRSEIVLA